MDIYPYMVIFASGIILNDVEIHYIKILKTKNNIE